MLQQGEPVTYIQRQLGHASIQLTVDTYGKWLPMGNKSAVDRLDAVPMGVCGSKVVEGRVSPRIQQGGVSLQMPKFWRNDWKLATGIEPSNRRRSLQLRLLRRGPSPLVRSP